MSTVMVSEPLVVVTAAEMPASGLEARRLPVGVLTVALVPARTFWTSKLADGAEAATDVPVIKTVIVSTPETAVTAAEVPDSAHVVPLIRGVITSLLVVP